MKKIPLHSLVMMVGPSGAGKSTVIAENFEPYEVVSSDAIRHELVGDFTRQDINDIVFRELYHRIATKLDMGERVVVDATNLHYKDRAGVAEIGIRRGVSVFYIVVNRSLEEKLETQGWRANVPGLVERHDNIFRSNEREIMRGDGIANVIDCRMPCSKDFDVVNKLPQGNVLNEIIRRGFHGVTVVADVHGNVESLKSVVEWAMARKHFLHFLGDIVDYGPKSLECVDIVYDKVMRGQAAFTMGNHEHKILRWIEQQRKLAIDPNALRGKQPIKLSEGNKTTTDQVVALSPDARRKFENKFKALVSFARHHWVMGNNTLFVHGAAEPEMFHMNMVRLSGKLESMCLYGEVDQQNPSRRDGYPNRVYTWVDRIPTGKNVYVGHDIRSTTKPLVVTGSLGGIATFLDTGSAKGGRLTSADMLIVNGELILQNFSVH